MPSPPTVVLRPHPGDLIHGKYRIIRAVAEGGMGTIYEARHERLGTTLALKFLHPELTKRPGLVTRFLQEAKVSATLRSPHIVQVIDVESDAAGAYLVMELLQGESLQQHLDRQKKLERAMAIDVAVQILAGLDVAHQAGVVHRDLKPDNVFLTQTPQGELVKILDFGIAKLRASEEMSRGLTRAGVVMGTPEYMAPEQAESADRVDARADIYALGVMLFEMLAGQRPVAGDDPQKIAAIVMAGGATPLSLIDPTLPPSLVSLVHRAMAPRVADRFATAAEMQRALLPFASLLSPAGHQAAGLATGSMASWPGPLGRASAVPQEPPRAVAKTLPPEGASPGPGATAPREPMREAFATPPPEPAWQRDDRTHLTPGLPPGYGAAQQPMGPPPAYGGSSPGPSIMYAPPPAPAGRRGPSLALMALLATLAGGLLVALIVVMRAKNTDSDPTSPPPTAAPTTPTTASSTTPNSTTTMTTPPPITPPPTSTHPGPPGPPGSAHPPSHDGGVPDAGAADAGPGNPFGLPPLPNLFDAGMPALPPGIPTQITIPLPTIPGFPPFPQAPGAPPN